MYAKVCVNITEITKLKPRLMYSKPSSNQDSITVVEINASNYLPKAGKLHYMRSAKYTVVVYKYHCYLKY
jgi:hypothetical protein